MEKILENDEVMDSWLAIFSDKPKSWVIQPQGLGLGFLMLGSPGCEDGNLGPEPPELDWNMFPPNPWFHTQRTHPNNIIYLSPEDQWKHWLYAVILTYDFQDLGFYII